MAVGFVTDQFGNLQVTSAKIGAAAIIAGKIAVAGISASDQFAAGVVDSSALAAASVTAGKIGVGGISASDQFAAGVVDTAALGALAVTPAKADLGQVWAFTAAPSYNADPVGANDLVRKSYADAIAAGLSDFKDSVRVATTAALPAVTAAGTGVGKTLTADAVGILTVDDVAMVLGNRILVKNQVAGDDNCIYEVTTEGTAGVAFVLTRATDADTDAEVTAGMYLFVDEGTTNADTAWVLATNDPIVVDTTSLSFTKFSSIADLIAGAGLSKSGTTISVELSADAGLEFDAGGDDGKLQVKLDGATLTRAAAGLKVSDAGVGETQLADDSVTLAKTGWLPYFDSFAGDEVTTKFSLTQLVLATHYAGVAAWRQGQRLKYVIAAPTDLSEYRVIEEIGVTKIELGAALPTGEVLWGGYIA